MVNQHDKDLIRQELMQERHEELKVDAKVIVWDYPEYKLKRY